MSAWRNDNVMVLGLGNTLLADDGVGVHVVRRLAADAATPAWVVAVDGGTMGFRLTGVLDGAGGVLIVDAAALDAPAGTIRLLQGEALDGHVARHNRSSAHEAGLADLLTLLRLGDGMPRRMAVLAIQPRMIDWGEALSDAVGEAVGPACVLAKATAFEWRGGA